MMMLTTTLVAAAALCGAAAPAQDRSAEAATATATTSSPSTQARITPKQAAEAAIIVAEHGSAADALKFARLALENAPRMPLSQLAMAYALDASGQGFEAIEFAKRYNGSPGGEQDWRGHAKLASIYVRTKNFRMALAEVKAAEASPLFASIDPSLRAFVLVDKAEAYIGMRGRENLNEAAKYVDNVGELLNRSTSARSNLPLVLRLSRVLFGLAELNRAYIDEAFRVLKQNAIPLAEEQRRKAGPMDRAALQRLIDCYSLARQVRGIEVDGLQQRDKEDHLIEADPATLADEQRTLRTQRLQRLTLAGIDLLRTDLEVAELENRARLLDLLNYAKKAIEVSPRELELRFALGDIYHRLDDEAKMRETIEGILSIDPANKRAADILRIVSKQAASTAPASRNATTNVASQPGPMLPPK